MGVGTHVIGELYGCPAQSLGGVAEVRALMHRVVEEAHFRVVGEKFHQFEPCGVTGVMVLRESHFSVHTWPEEGVIAADIFTCGKEGNAVEAFDLLCRLMEPERIERRIIER